MELLAIAAIETALIGAQVGMIRYKRLRILNKWARGQMSEVELEQLKQTPWFQKAFPPKEVELGKKND